MITFENVTKVYQNQTAPALSHIDVSVDRGEFAFLVGASGSGKSTFLRLIVREIRATSGRVLVDGRDVGRLGQFRVPKLRRKVGMVFQDFRLLPGKTVYENVAFGLQVLSLIHI